MPGPRNELRYRFEARPRARSDRKLKLWSTVDPALPRITRLMALAIKLDTVLQQSRDLDVLELARRSFVTRTRMTQILNLLHLAPDIQEQLLWLPPLARGHEVISEKSLRRLTGEYRWERQRERFAQLLSLRNGRAGSPLQ